MPTPREIPITRWRLWTLMAGVAAAAVVLMFVRPMVPGWIEAFRIRQAERAIRTQLERPVAMPFPDGVSLEDFLIRVREATKSGSLPDGLPILVDPIGLQEVDHALNSTVRLNTRTDPVKTSLEAALGQLGLVIYLDRGLLIVTSKESADVPVWTIEVETDH